MLYEEFRNQIKSTDRFKHLSDEEFDTMLKEIFCCKPYYLDISHWLVFILVGDEEAKESVKQIKEILSKYDKKKEVQ